MQTTHTVSHCCGSLTTIQPAARLTDDLAVLADPVRLQLLSVLAASPDPVCVCDLESAVPVKQPTVSHHLKQLRRAGLVEREKRGPWAYYHVQLDALAALRTRIVTGLDALSGGAAAANPAAVLRPAGRADLGAILGLLRAAGLPDAGVADHLEGGYVVAESGGLVVGAAGLEQHGDDGLLRSVVVAPAWRGRGVGEAMVRERVAAAESLGLSGVYLLTTTAASWFPRLGFAPVERGTVPEAVRSSPEFDELCPSTAVVMALRPRGDGAAIRARIRDRYGAAAAAVAAGGAASCCDVASCCDSRGDEWNPITSDLYEAGEAAEVPAEALLASLGCGNPTALASLAQGETVLDLGSGGGIDVLLSARRVGPAGRAYGLDMTDEMLALARSNQAKAGVTNVEFLKGDIEAIPLPDASVDVVISNCVINLAADKSRVLREAYRVLRPGGRFAVSDVVARREVPPALRRNMELWLGCVAGALEEQEYARLLGEAGFKDISLEPTRIYRSSDALHLLAGAGMDPSQAADMDRLDGAFMSAFVRAVKPA
jgi:arsenite methyltransferase